MGSLPPHTSLSILLKTLLETKTIHHLDGFYNMVAITQDRVSMTASVSEKQLL